MDKINKMVFSQQNKKYFGIKFSCVKPHYKYHALTLTLKKLMKVQAFGAICTKHFFLLYLLLLENQLLYLNVYRQHMHS